MKIKRMAFSAIVWLVMVLIMMVPMFAWSAQGGAASKPIVLRYVGQMPEKSNITKHMRKWAQMVEQRSNGRVQFQIFPGGQLYKHEHLVNVLPQGIVDLGESGGASMSGLLRTAGIYEMAMLYKSWDHLKATLDEGRKILDADAERNGVKDLFLMPYGENCGFATNKKVRTLEDLSGLKIRCVSAEIEKVFSALGATSTHMASSEVYQALQLGAIDAGQSTWASYADRRWYEITKYLVDFPVQYGMFHTYVSLKSWGKLPKDIQEIMVQAGKESYDWALREAVNYDEKSRKLVIEKGMDVYKLPPKELERWRKKVEPLWDGFGKINPDCARLLDIAKKLSGHY